MSSNREYLFTWVVENFNLLPLEKGERIKSPIFLVKEFFNTCWYLELYPRGCNSSISTEFISCFLIKSKGNGPQKIKIDFLLSIDDVTERGNHCFRDGFLSSGWFKFLSREKIAKFHDCVIQCHMRMFSTVEVGGVITEEPSHFLMPYSWSSQKMVPEFMKESALGEKKDVDETAFSTACYSSQSFVRTRVFVEKRIFICAIKEYLYPGSKNRQLIPVATPYGTLLIVLLMSNKDSIDLLEVEICLKDEWESNCMLNCKIELLDFNKQIYSSEEEAHLFDISKDDNWNFGHPLKWFDLECLNYSSLRFTLTFSNGYSLSDIEWSTGVEELNFHNDVSKDLHRLFIEKKFCDVIIQTKDESFDVHKTVLCSRSPAFATKFDRVKEEVSNVIHIDDLDSDTVRQMLRFMYTGSTENLNTEIAMKLYSAADKYEMNSMKDNCRNFLKNNLTIQNTCSLCLFANKYEDAELFLYAVIFFSYHRKYIFESENWKELKRNNVCLCFEILENVCL